MKGSTISLPIRYIGSLMILLVIMFALYNVYGLNVTKNKATHTEKVSRDIANLLGTASRMESGAINYNLPENRYDIQLTPGYVIVSDKGIRCEKGCSYTLAHNLEGVQAGFIVPGTEKICAVKTYDDGAPVIYLCDAEGKDLRCNCELGSVHAKPYTERFSSNCKLKLVCLDNYGEAGKDNTVKMTVRATNCEGIYLTPFGSPTKEWVYGDILPPNNDNSAFTALRHKITYDCVEKGKNVDNEQEPEYCDELKADKESRRIKSSLAEVSVEYFCMGETSGNKYFLFDFVAIPADNSYPQDSVAKIQTQVGCNKKPAAIVCVGPAGTGYNAEGRSYCIPPGKKIDNMKNNCEAGKYLCIRSGFPYPNLCVPKYYDSNCVPEEVYERGVIC